MVIKYSEEPHHTAPHRVVDARRGHDADPVSSLLGRVLGLELSGDETKGRLCLGYGDVRFEPPYQLETLRGPIGQIEIRQDELRGRERGPDLHRKTDERSLKAFRRNADYREWRFVQENRRSEKRRVSTGPALPIAVTHDRHGISTAPYPLLLPKPPTHSRPNGKQIEIVDGYELHPDGFAAAGGAQSGRPTGQHDELGQHVVALAVIYVIGIGEPGKTIPTRNVGEDVDDSGRIADRQRA